MQLTDGQNKALAFAPKPSATLSFLGSLYIVVTVARNRELRARVYHRLCLAMSLNSLIYSAIFFWGTWAMPADAIGAGYGASGTWSTCEAQGFLVQQGFSAPCYYASLSLYSLVAVRNNFNEARISRFEPLLHLVCNGYPLAMAIVLLQKDLLNPSGAWCWIQEYPMGCSERGNGQCLRGQDVDVYMWAFAYGTMFLMLGFSTVMMALLFWIVRRRESASRKYVGKKVVMEKVRRNKSMVVLWQASQYLAAFYATYFFSIVSRLVKTTTGSLNPNLHIVATAVVPLQGFFYFIVYWRLRLERNKRRHSTASRLSVATQITRHLSLENTDHSSHERWGLGRTRNTTRIEDKEQFSIFDGTNGDADSPWAKFLAGDDEDEPEKVQQCDKDEALKDDALEMVSEEGNIDSDHKDFTDETETKLTNETSP